MRQTTTKGTCLVNGESTLRSHSTLLIFSKNYLPFVFRAWYTWSLNSQSHARVFKASLPDGSLFREGHLQPHWVKTNLLMESPSIWSKSLPFKVEKTVLCFGDIPRVVPWQFQIERHKFLQVEKKTNRTFYHYALMGKKHEPEGKGIRN